MNAITSITDKSMDMFDAKEAVARYESGLHISTIAPSFDLTDLQLMQVMHDKAGYSYYDLNNRG